MHLFTRQPNLLLSCCHASQDGRSHGTRICFRGEVKMDEIATAPANGPAPEKVRLVVQAENERMVKLEGELSVMRKGFDHTSGTARGTPEVVEGNYKNIEIWGGSRKLFEKSFFPSPQSPLPFTRTFIFPALKSFTVIPQDDGLMDFWITGLLG